ncbi:MAG: RNA-directed DNA polymerase [Anaerolineae bacterium]
MISVRKSRPTSGCSRIATARFFKHFLLAKLAYNGANRAGPQSAEPRALGSEVQVKHKQGKVKLMDKISLPDINKTSHRDFFISPENFQLAWERVRYFDRSDSRDWLGLKVFAANRDHNLEILRQSIIHKTFEASSPEIKYFPKQSQTLRPMAVLPIKDRVAFQAIANVVAEFGRSTLSLAANRQSFANVLRPPEIIQMFSPWKEQYSAFQAKYGELIDEGNSWVVETDIAAFYETIDHSKLFETLLNGNFLDEVVLEYLKTYLPVWASVKKGQKSPRGVPQGCLSSDLLANVCLAELDTELATREYHYLRYVDDIRLVADKKDKVQRGLIFLDRNLKALGLLLQTKKTVVRSITSKESEFDRLSSVLSDLDRRYKEKMVIAKTGETDTLSEPSLHDIAGQGFDFDPDQPIEASPENPDVQNDLSILFWRAVSELGNNPYAERHMRYCLWRLSSDDSVRDFVVQNLLERPWITNLFCFYLSKCQLSEDNLKSLHAIISDHNVYDSVVAGIIDMLHKKGVSLRQHHGQFRRWLMNSERDWVLLSVVATVLGASTDNLTVLVKAIENPSVNPIVRRSSLIQASKLAKNIHEAIPILRLGVLDNTPIVIDSALYLLYVDWKLNIEKLSLQETQKPNEYCLAIAKGYDESLPQYQPCYIRHVFAKEYSVDFAMSFDFHSILNSDYDRAAYFLWQAQLSFLTNPSRYVSQLDLFHEEILFPLLVDKLKWKPNKEDLVKVSLPDRMTYLRNNHVDVSVFASTILECHTLRSGCTEAHTRLDKVTDITSPVSWRQRNALKKNLCGAYQELSTWLIANP